ncbi:hypothetical protein RN053_20940 [Pantoea dispersa]|uniref:hypothetical protein n=1 Tax=Pantoea dispersa TaxID=59814 RepID=UPI0028DF5142|nr:hypothetical protein [Pantoea dispersa]MDT8852979.1 hypothetical protein [Pantoea dispersa]
MVTEHATVTFYKINKCGFYRYGEDNVAFGSTKIMLSDLANWAKGKTLKQTKNFIGNDDVLPAYLIDSRQSGDNFLVVLWNEVPSSDGKVPSVSENTRFGSLAKAILNDIEKGSIPGFATYFWFIPSMNLVATIKLKHAFTGQKSMQLYLKTFLKQSCSYVVSDIVENDEGKHDVVIKGYSSVQYGKELTKKKHYPYFETGIIKNPGKHDIIKQNYNNISKIEKIIELDVANKEHMDIWQKLLVFTNISKRQNADVSTKIRYELSPDVSLKDVKSMIADWNENGVNDGCDYGFTFKGSSKVYWLSRSLARVSDFAFNIERNDEEFIEPNSLLKELVGKRRVLLNEAGLL